MTAPARLSAARLDELVAAVAPVDDAALAPAAGDAQAERLFGAIVGPRSEAPPAAAGRDPFDGVGTAQVIRLHRRRLAPMLAAAALVLVGAVIGPLLASHPSKSRGAGASVEVALSTKSGAVFEAFVPGRAILGHEVEVSDLPARIPVFATGKVVGYIDRTEVAARLAPTSTTAPRTCGTGGVPVYSSTGIVVGNLYPSAGYVPLGAQPDCDRAPGGVPAGITGPLSQCNVAITVTGAGGVAIQQCAYYGGGTGAAGNTGSP